MKTRVQTTRVGYISSPILNNIYVIVSKFGRISQNNGHYAVEGRSRSLTLVPIESLCDLLLVINNSLIYPISHRFKVITDYIGLKKLETS